MIYLFLSFFLSFFDCAFLFRFMFLVVSFFLSFLLSSFSPFLPFLSFPFLFFLPSFVSLFLHFSVLVLFCSFFQPICWPIFTASSLPMYLSICPNTSSQFLKPINRINQPVYLLFLGAICFIYPSLYLFIFVCLCASLSVYLCIYPPRYRCHEHQRCEWCFKVLRLSHKVSLQETKDCLKYGACHEIQLWHVCDACPKLARGCGARIISADFDQLEATRANACTRLPSKCFKATSPETEITMMTQPSHSVPSPTVRRVCHGIWRPLANACGCNDMFGEDMRTRRPLYTRMISDLGVCRVFLFDGVQINQPRS